MKLILMMIFISVACTKKNTPEGVLSDFISKRFEGNIDKEVIVEYITGELAQEIETMSDEEFNEFVAIDQLKKRKLVISNKSCENNKCYLTYLLSYNTIEDGQKAFQTDTKKIAEISNTESGWKISKITHLKTFHDSKQEIDITDK